MSASVLSRLGLFAWADGFGLVDDELLGRVRCVRRSRVGELSRARDPENAVWLPIGVYPALRHQAW